MFSAQAGLGARGDAPFAETLGRTFLSSYLRLNMPERAVRAEILVDTTPEEVWNAWTTVEGIQSFFAPACCIELQSGGAYEIYFFPDAPAGQRGAEGTRILALQAPRMLSFTWNAPPHLPEVRAQQTHVTVWITEAEGAQSRVILVQDGWGEGGEWEEAYRYFTHAWAEVVLPRLQQRFATDPIRWSPREALPSETTRPGAVRRHEHCAHGSIAVSYDALSIEEAQWRRLPSHRSFKS